MQRQLETKSLSQRMRQLLSLKHSAGKEDEIFVPPSHIWLLKSHQVVINEKSWAVKHGNPTMRNIKNGKKGGDLSLKINLRNG